MKNSDETIKFILTKTRENRKKVKNRKKIGEKKFLNEKIVFKNSFTHFFTLQKSSRKRWQISLSI